MPATREDTFTLGLTRSSLEGELIFACTKCGAPGVYSDHVSIQTGWPACYDPSRKQRHVGDICPQCGASRKPNLHKGELQSNIPLWVWKLIVGAKGLYIRFRRFGGKLYD